MNRFILLNDGSGERAAVEAMVEALPDASILDRTDDRAILIEASDEAIERLSRDLAGWRISREIGYARPAPPFPRPAWDLTASQSAARGGKDGDD